MKLLFTLWDSNIDLLLINVIKVVADTGLFAIPDVFATIMSRADSAEDESVLDDSNETSDSDPKIDAWDRVLSAPFSQLAAYVEYISDKPPFVTHQGIKGLQFPRVVVVLDDNEARGFMFSYDKLFGAKAPTTTDIKNEKEGKESSVDRTRRCFTSHVVERKIAWLLWCTQKKRIKSKNI